MGDRRANQSDGCLAGLTHRASAAGGTVVQLPWHCRTGRPTDEARGARDYFAGGSFTQIVRTLTGLLLVTALGGCQEDMGSEDWLVVDNRTDSEVFVTDAGVTGSGYLGSVGAGSSAFGAGAVDRCEARALVAHAGSPDGPVVARRTAADGEACVRTWVVGPDD